MVKQKFMVIHELSRGLEGRRWYEPVVWERKEQVLWVCVSAFCSADFTGHPEKTQTWWRKRWSSWVLPTECFRVVSVRVSRPDPIQEPSNVGCVQPREGLRARAATNQQGSGRQ